MRVDEEAKRRFAALLTIVGIMLGGLALSGPLERLVVTPALETEAPRFDQTRLTAMRAEAARLRSVQRQVALLGQKGKWLEAAQLAAANSKVEERNRFGLMALQAEALYRAGKTTEAVALYEQLLFGNDPVTVADRLALKGDRDAYRKHCADILSQPIEEGNSNSRVSPGTESNNAAWMCLVAPDALPDYSRPVALARTAVQRARPAERGLFLNTLGVALYRAGKDAEAISTLLQSEKAAPEPFNWPFLALAYQRTGDNKTAQRWFDRLQKLMQESYGANAAQNSRHELLLFHREAASAFTAK